jgi:hypothetical protein
MNLQKHGKELSEVVSQFEIVRKHAVTSLIELNKGDSQLAEIHYLSLLKEMKDLNAKMSDLKRHIAEDEHGS